MARYRKKPVVIDAFCLGRDYIPDWFMDKVSANEIVTRGEYGMMHSCEIHTLEGVMIASQGDWIILGTFGEVYPCKAAIFTATYEAVEHGEAR